MKQSAAVLIVTILLATPALADELNTRALVGGGLGGALGALIGSEVGGRNGAILGGGLGGALGSIVATDRYQDRRYFERDYYVPANSGSGYRGQDR
jgi:outer membrane lipoprotein SlyB